ncbi:hypothetical protein B1987_07130 [Mycobacterium kansasii]|nr:hypothetical protein B1987_07130 [Mycobacterium kansasii]
MGHGAGAYCAGGWAAVVGPLVAAVADGRWLDGDGECMHAVHNNASVTASTSADLPTPSRPPPKRRGTHTRSVIATC